PTAGLPAAAVLACALVAGFVHARAWEAHRLRDCRLALPDGGAHLVTGRVESAPPRGRWVLRVEEGFGPGCRPPVRVLLPAPVRASLDGRTAVGGAPGAGARVEVEGRWRRLSPGGGDPRFSGELVAEAVREAPGQ